MPISGYPDEIAHIRKGESILFECGDNQIPGLLAQILGHKYSENGGKVLYITSRNERFVSQQLRRIDSRGVDFDIYEKVDPFNFSKAFRPGSLVIIDSVEYLLYHLDHDELMEVFESMNEKCKEAGSILIMVGQISTLDIKSQVIIRHNVDGIMQFLYNERPEGINRFIRIPRWTDGRPYDSNIFYKYENERINIDLRSRVV